MKFTRLRIAGFKSFVEPSEFVIEPGLTGVVGPNGCGKSNLVEALRWVMGESSFKNMRASGMDDVIFAGSGNRPARNSAEVVLTVDNSARTAPAAFNDAELLDISRKIVREEGSTYRINGKEVRARDVQLLFADAASGARSSSLVRQGQIGELIAAKPQARRRILEDAAGIAGLHSRRHEAELRLRAADENLVRLEDVLREIEAQGESLRRQAKQAGRYRGLAADIRKAEALLAIIGHEEARQRLFEAERALEAEIRKVADATREQAEAARNQAVAAHALEPLREAEAAAAATLQRLVIARDALDAEEKRAAARTQELDRRIAEIERDIARETALAGDASGALARLAEEEVALAAAAEAAGTSEADAAEALARADAALLDAEGALSALQNEAADLQARRAAQERGLREEAARCERLAAERDRVAREKAALDAADGGPERLEAGREALEAAERVASDAESDAGTARTALAAARERETAARNPATEAERRLQALETEIRTLAKLFAPATGDLWPPVLDQVRVAKGYEAALGAALGEDLDAAADPSAPVHWALTQADGDPALPAGATALASVAQGPAVLARRLAQIGVVERADGPRLAKALLPGQRLVSREGDLWRWDGYNAAAEAPSAAARRLAEKNRLADLEADRDAARDAASVAKAALEEAQGAVRTAAAAEAAALDRQREARRALDEARAALAKAERAASETAARRSALAEAASRIEADLAETNARRELAEAALAELAARPDLDQKLLAARADVAEKRVVASEARADLQTLRREAELRRTRRDAIVREVRDWNERASRADTVAKDLAVRLDAARGERAGLDDAPAQFLARRRALADEIGTAEAGRRAAADRLAQAQTALADADRAARATLEALGNVREARAGAEARLEAARARLTELVRAIAENHETTPQALREQAGLEPGAPLPEPGGIESRLASLRAERERLGAVNLRAEEELAEVETKRDGLIAERDDLTEAIRRLRQAIGSLNREGRERLLAAFATVDGHFRALFTSLFGGGTAELSLVDSDDPLEAGLEIVARPPGKKPQILTLLSGGEQALTATALIFAVFLTNPSPICVLDEVDAPLDDANVERYCDLLVNMARQTDTRFIVITHNPITMARMNRLFGVTMAERGVSTLVSVDLETAAALREAV